MYDCVSSDFIEGVPFSFLDMELSPLSNLLYVLRATFLYTEM